MKLKSLVLTLAVFVPALLLAPGAGTAAAFAQNLESPSADAPGTPTAAGSLHGVVADPSGAVIPGATVNVSSVAGQINSATADSGGAYTIPGLAPGTYTITATAPGFAPVTIPDVHVGKGQAKLLNFSLVIEVQQQNVEVNVNAPTVSVSPDQNANSVIITGKDLDALSDDPTELQNELNALAGPGAGPSGAQIFIDGFTAGQLPPKSAIREIKINQNPFSAEFDKLGYGRIEILTKPGTDKFHGQVFMQGNSSGLNTGNPFSKNIPSYYSYQYNGTLSGPINKNASFFVSAEQRHIGDDAIIFAYNPNDLDFAHNTLNFQDALPNPRLRTNIAPRVDLQLGKNNTLSVRYQYFDNYQQNEGVGQFSLRDQAYNAEETESTLQMSDTQIVSSKVINEILFQWLHDRSSQTPAAFTPQVQVGGAFTTGGNQEQAIQDHTDRYELQDIATIATKTHAIDAGFRLRIRRDANSANSGFNGVFTFGQRPCPPSGCPATLPGCSGTSASGCTISALSAYKITQLGLQNGESFSQILAQGGGASQLTYVTGTPAILVHLTDAGIFYQDDWRVSKNFTFSYGMRFETQTNIPDHEDWGPRLSFAYGISRHNHPPKTVLRGGFGIFYDRFHLAQIQQAARQNNIVQKETVVADPACFFTSNIAQNDLGACAGAGSTSSLSAIYQIAPNLHAPQIIQGAFGIEHQVSKNATFSLTYLASRGEYQLVTRNANAPYSPTYNPAEGNVYQYYSEGLFNQNQLIANFNLRAGQKLSFFGFNTLSYANSDANGVSSNPSNSDNLHQDYGRAAFDSRDQFFFMGSWAAPYALRVSPFVVFNAGRPFNITLSQDQNGDSFFTDRPAFAQPGDTNILKTSYGTFNVTPGPNEAPIPIYYGNGPNLFAFNLRLSKTIGFGQKTKAGGGPAGGPHGGGPRGGLGGRGLSGGGPHGGFGDNTGRRYNLTLSAQALNLFNDINLAPPTGVVDSPEFGQSNQLAGRIFSSGSASRRIFLQAIFTF
ncbi:TonB-dependent receptor [Acidipila rosea]|uniref:Carboxypeptidase family protein n=1 Tax=Acidipila rosea TaxID=768535 RepID=A0A4R1L4M2_9BACT|nr:carboxypeptidase-like regulatory domain-containing protein [Acidipila rosea]TCK72067.1 carboxypeptidase family protein [Acidipila rosea]